MKKFFWVTGTEYSDVVKPIIKKKIRKMEFQRGLSNILTSFDIHHEDGRETRFVIAVNKSENYRSHKALIYKVRPDGYLYTGQQFEFALEDINEVHVSQLSDTHFTINISETPDSGLHVIYQRLSFFYDEAKDAIYFNPTPAIKL